MIWFMIGSLLVIYLIGIVIFSLVITFDNYNLDTGQFKWEALDSIDVALWPISLIIGLLLLFIETVGKMWRPFVRRVNRSKRIMRALEK